MSTFAPLQFLKSAQNPLVWTAVDNGTDTRTSLIIYYGAANTLPSDTGMYEVNCIMMHQTEKQLYANTGTTTTPNWEAFGPNSAFPNPLVPGTFLFTDGVSVYWSPALVGQIQEDGVNLPQRGILNFEDFLIASDDAINGRINVNVDVVAIALDNDFVDALVTNSYFTNSLANNTAFIDSLIANSYFTDELADSVAFIDSLIANTYFTSELATNTSFIGDIITQINNAGDIEVVADGVTITGTGTTLDPLVAVGGSGGTGTALETTISQTAHGLSVGDVIKVSGTNTFAKAQANTEVNSETVGIVTTVVNANSFKYVSSAIQLAYAPVGTPGSAVWLSPTVAGGMTTTKPSTVGQVARALGTIIESGAKMYFDIAALAEVIGSGGGGGGGGANTITATAGMDIDGSTTPKPVTFGNSDTGSPTNYNFFNQIGGGTFIENVGTTTREKVCYTFQVMANNIVQVDYLVVQIQGVVGSPVDQLRLSLQETTAGVPNGTILDSGTISVSGPFNYFVGFANPVFLTPGVYAVVLDRTGAADNTNYWQHFSENVGGTNNAVSIFNGTNWINNNKLVSIRIGAKYPRDNVYISAQGSGFRLQSVIVSSGSGNTYKETIPAVLQDSHGFVTSNVSTGNTVSVAISGAVSGFTGLTPTSLYEVTSSNGTIGVGTGTDVGRALTTTDIVIIPA